MSISSFQGGVKPSLSDGRIINPETGEVLSAAQTRQEERTDERFSEAGVPDASASAGVAPRQPPYSKTGVSDSHLQETVFSVDWNTLTIHAPLEVVMDALREVGYDAGLENAGHGTQHYRELYRSPFGVHLRAVPINDLQEHCSVALTGGALEHFGVESWYAFGGVLARLGREGVRVKCTRLDAAFDTQKFTVQQVEDADAAGLLNTASRRRNAVRETVRGEVLGHTYYVGSRQSEAFARIYYKTDGCSFGDEAFTRVELEMHGDRADAAFWTMMAFGLEYAVETGARLLNGFMDIDADWWQGFKLSLENAWMKLRRKVATITSKKTWVYGQVSRSFAVCVDALEKLESGSGWSFVMDVLETGRKAYTKTERDLIRLNDRDALPEFMMGGLS